jgi:UDP-N-acetylglucosamine pyrophosphorylase
MPELSALSSQPKLAVTLPPVPGKETEPCLLSHSLANSHYGTPVSIKEAEEILLNQGISPALVTMYIDAAKETERLLNQKDSSTIPSSSISPVEQKMIVQCADLRKNSTYLNVGDQLINRGNVLQISLSAGAATSIGAPDVPKACLPCFQDGEVVLTHNDLLHRQREASLPSGGSTVPLVTIANPRGEQHIQADQRFIEAAGDYPTTVVQPEFPVLQIVEHEDGSVKVMPNFARSAPMGHGQIFGLLYYSGLLQEAHDNGIELLVISNADNVGFRIKREILGALAEEGKVYAQEYVHSIPGVDNKGGKLGINQDGRYQVCESAQMAAGSNELDLDFHNTNNQYINVKALLKLFEEGKLTLPLMLNRKPLVIGDPLSPDVIQPEWASPHIISLFDRKDVLIVSDTRSSSFMPFKDMSQWVVRNSNAYTSNEGGPVPVNSSMRDPEVPPVLVLEGDHYKYWDSCRERLSVLLGLKDAVKVTIKGNIQILHHLDFEGECAIIDERKDQSVPYIVPEVIVCLEDNQTLTIKDDQDFFITNQKESCLLF